MRGPGAKGPLAEEEARLVRFREELEGGAREELVRARTDLEAEAETSKLGKLCATPFGIDVVGITEFVALTGALVGGFSARQRKEEVERLNEQLRKINMSLRQQARAGTVYAPGLNYAPLPSFAPAGAPARGPEADLSGALLGSPSPGLVSIDYDAGTSEPSVAGGSAGAVRAGTGVARRTGAAPGTALGSLDEDDLPSEARQCTQALREGKRLLKERAGAPALVRFEKALMLAKALGDPHQERRATRGLAAAARIQGQHREAIKHLRRVLEISNEISDHVGDADAYGTIADIYTEMGEFERAAHFYDKYISRMSKDGPV